MKLISVIMSVFNEKPEWLIEAIESIINQTYSNLEFIIVLDNPTNSELKNILLDYANKDSRIILLINKQNLGLVNSLNLALERCSGKYIARMDADDISYPTRLEDQLKYLNHNNLDLVGSNVILFNDQGDFYTTDKLITHKYISKLLIHGTVGIVHPTFFGKSEVFLNLGGYREALHAEDMELLARIIFNNYKVGNLEKVLLRCRYSTNSVTKKNAYLMYETARYCRKVFNKSLSSGEYSFDNSYIKNLSINKSKLDRFNKKQKLMSEARQALGDKRYYKLILKLTQATFYSTSTLTSFKVNILTFLFKRLENIDKKILINSRK